MKKVIVTGANGVGKSRFAARLAAARPDVPIISFDAIKLETRWRVKPRAEIDAALKIAIGGRAWILEGGPSLLPLALAKADALIWLDPPEYQRAWRLASRPWKFLGRTRPELPEGNVDWPIQQYLFAIRSLSKRSDFRRRLSFAFEAADGVLKKRCRTEGDGAAFLREWARCAE